MTNAFIEHQPTFTELAKVIRDQTLRLVDELYEFRHGPVTAYQLGNRRQRTGFAVSRTKGGGAAATDTPTR